MIAKKLFFHSIYLLVKKEHHYIIEKQENKDVYFFNLVDLFKSKYDQSEINKGRTTCMFLLEERITFIKSVFLYLLGSEYIEDVFKLDLNEINFDEMLLLYNSVLCKYYNEPNCNKIEEYLVTKYSSFRYSSFIVKEEATIDDVIYLFDFILYEYKSCLILQEQLSSFFINLSNGSNNNNCALLDYLVYQMEYLFFTMTLDSFISKNVSTNYIKKDDVINFNIHETSMRLRFVFSISNCGMYNSSTSLNDPYLGFIDSIRRDLSILIENPRSNRSDLLYYSDRYNQYISPFVIEKDNKFIFYFTDDMISFNYLENFIASFFYLSLNSTSFFFYYLLELVNFLENKKKND